MMDIPKSPRTPGEAREAYEQVANALQAARETLLLHAARLSDPVWSTALTIVGGASVSTTTSDPAVRNCALIGLRSASQAWTLSMLGWRFTDSRSSAPMPYMIAICLARWANQMP
jgi:hypothetical protein